MKNRAYIWDLDGTLFDSYEVIASSTWQTLQENGQSDTYEEVRRFVLTSSVSDRLRLVSEKTGIPAEVLQKRYREISEVRILEIGLMPHAAEILQTLQLRGDRHFVVTHRGTSTRAVLEHTGLLPFFEEIITAVDGFPRKPSPDAVSYLLRKYELDPSRTYYVGDRRLDMQCAANAGIPGIFYYPDQTIPCGALSGNTIVTDLLDIAALPEKEG